MRKYTILRKIGSIILTSVLIFTSVLPVYAENSLVGSTLVGSTLTDEQRLDTSQDMYGQFYQYTGTSQTYTIPVSGFYNVYCKGGPRGGCTRVVSGSAILETEAEMAYSPVICGVFYLEKNTELKIDVGGRGETASKGNIATGGYNGGGSSNQNQSNTSNAASSTRIASGGGGATAVYAKRTNSSEFQTLIIAGGAGGKQAGIRPKDSTTITYTPINYGTSLTASSSARAGGGGGYPGGAGSYSKSTTYKWSIDPTLRPGCINLAAYANVCNSTNLCTACSCTSSKCNCPYTSPSLTTSYTTTKTTWYDGMDGGCLIHDMTTYGKITCGNNSISIPELSLNPSSEHTGGYTVYVDINSSGISDNPYPFGRPTTSYYDGLVYIGLSNVCNLIYNGYKPEYINYNGNPLKYYYYNNVMVFKASKYSISDRWIRGGISSGE